MWFFLKQKKDRNEDIDNSSNAGFPPTKVRTMADDLAEGEESQQISSSQELSSSNIVFDSEAPSESSPIVVSPTALPDDGLTEGNAPILPVTETVLGSGEALSLKNHVSASTKHSINDHSFSMSSPSSSERPPAPIETSPFLGGASRARYPEVSQKDSLGDSSSIATNAPHESSDQSSDLPPTISSDVSKREIHEEMETPTLSENAKVAMPIQRLERKQAELRTGNWPVGDEKKLEKDQVKKLDASDSSDVFSGPKKKMFSEENVIIAEESIGKKIVTSMIIAVVLIALCAVAYYFWQTLVRHTAVVVPSSLRDVLPQRGEVDVADVSVATEYPFSVSEPNLFVVDVETETLSMLRKKLLDDAKRMQDSDMRVPVQFTVVDKNNTPIAFFIFASVFNLGLSGDLLNSLGNDFSLYLYLDNGAPRLGLAVTFKNVESARTAIRYSESVLPINLKNLLLEDDVSISSSAAFGDGFYESIPTRFFNFDTPEPLSIDYAFMRDYLAIGTSRDTLHAIIDEVLKP